jgi:hypothetical protein
LILLAVLVARPDLGLTILWNVLIPLVPASLLIAPMLWRNVCPLATLNMAPSRIGRGRHISNGAVLRAGSVGIVLLWVLVPARRFLFNTDGPILAATVAAVAVLALAGGYLFDAKAGFCNSICPVLPVERLYGQSPLVDLTNPRCVPCTNCTSRGCIDLSPSHAVPMTLGASRDSARWLLNPYGVFAASFPGFVFGYFTIADGPLSTAGTVYAHIGVRALVSYAAVAALTILFRLGAAQTMIVLGGLAAGLYYWFASPAIVTALELPDVVAHVMRLVTLALVAGWGARALVGGSRQASHGIATG